MTNPIAVFSQLRDTYLRYLDSPFDLRYEPLVAERRDMLDRDGRLYREPLIEPIPPYASSGRTFPAAAAQILGSSWPPSLIGELAGFVSQGLFAPSLELYGHQFEAIDAVVRARQDIVVTSGTGSGKTECFLLPIAAALIEESVRWGANPPVPATLDWWNHAAPPGSRGRHHPRVPQRGHENPATRPAALRALVMYPLNALAEDQLVRLRVGLDGAAARAWLDVNRGGNRFFFGRYTGRTPVAGDRTATKLAELRRELLAIQADANAAAANPDAARYFQNLGGAEMWSRWDMQDQPPDILITNYSMLNIMLMRNVEASIFDATGAWLAADQRNTFHLVVDELHTYRGTPGTEVAYLLRVLLDRLGLHPNHDQLRIIASSASLDAGIGGLDYLEGIFGRSRTRFHIIGGKQQAIDFHRAAGVAAHVPALVALNAGLTAKQPLSGLATAFEVAVGTPPLPPSATPEVRLGTALLNAGAVDALRFACSAGNPIRSRPQQSRQIGDAMFPGDTNARAATEGIIAGIGAARTAANDPVLPIRAHIMFRNVQGLWACTDAGCSAAPPRLDPCPVGALHHLPSPGCACGARVLELLYCEPCGEVFLGGYRGDTGNPGAWRLSPDFPDLEQVPDRAGADRDYRNFAIFWPAAGRTPATPNWQEANIAREWRRASLDRRTGIVSIGTAGDGYLYYVPSMHRRPRPGTQPPHPPPAFPSRCPRCDASWTGRDVGSPIRGQRTGFQKVAQLLGDALLREIAPPTQEQNRKLVVFSDSRQDAAKLSAGMRQAHHLDAVRQAVVLALSVCGRGAPAFFKQAQGQALTADEQEAASAYLQSFPNEATVLSMAAGPGAAMQFAPGQTFAQAAAAIVAQAAHLVQDQLSERLANAGILPMFGFPTRVRYLFHKPPAAGGQWPPEDVVDRPLDLAISQFAPASETVKEGLIQTSVGVVSYQRQGNRPVEMPNPLGPAIAVGICRRCQPIDPGVPPAATCTVCNGPQAEYQVVNLSQPTGFRTYYNAERDYDGSFEWTPRATRPKLGMGAVQLAVHRNFETFSGPETVYVINDNTGDLFDFEQFWGESWMTRDALAKVGARVPALPIAGPDRRALAAISPTDVLIAGIHAWPAGVFADPLRVEGRAALYSLGFMLRRAAAVRLDVADSELKIGLRTTVDSTQRIIGQIFISDTLENGAGYSTYLGTPAEFQGLLDAVCGPAMLNRLDRRLQPDDHGNACQTSCHECMRDYSNLAYHSILDWRLGVDMARLALDPAAAIDFSPAYWAGLPRLAVQRLHDALPGSTLAKHAGLPAVELGPRAIIAAHPLWDTRPATLHPTLAAAQASATASGLAAEFRSTFMLIRRPL